MVNNHPPDVVVVLLDTGRSDVVNRTSLAGKELGALSRIRRESVIFEEAYAPSTWTYPSHTSLFTGLYPWENASLSTEFAPLRPEYPHLARVLKERGYRTFSLSANPLVSPWTGLSAPFERSLWSQWWHLFLRVPSLNQPLGDGPMVGAPSPPLRALPSNLFTLAKRALLRHPRFAQMPSDLLNAVRDPRDSMPGAIDSWIEPKFDRWLEALPRAEPIFAFINLMEAHEPYLPGQRGPTGRRVELCRQDRESFLAGTWTPTERELARLRDLYSDGVETALRRASRIAETLERVGRMENTLFILTGDHGQELGELDGLFHGTYPGDPQTRIPLWLRLPGQSYTGRPAAGFASLVDIFGTVVARTGGDPAPRTSGTDLAMLADGQRSDPVFSYSEQLPDDGGFRMHAGSQWIGLNRFWIAGRQPEASLVVDSHRQLIYPARGSSERKEARGRPVVLDSVSAPSLLSGADRVYASIRSALENQATASADRRLRSWGYF